MPPDAAAGRPVADLAWAQGVDQESESELPASPLQAAPASRASDQPDPAWVLELPRAHLLPDLDASLATASDQAASQAGASESDQAASQVAALAWGPVGLPADLASPKREPAPQAGSVA